MAKPLVISELVTFIQAKITIHEDDHWLWTDQYDAGGYGVLSYQGTKYKMHRLSWTVFKGPIPKGVFVLHKCDIRNCINPEHLFLGMHQDNMADMRAKGRAHYQRVQKVLKGDGNPRNVSRPPGGNGRLPRLTAAQIAYIRSVYVRGSENPTMKQLADELQVSVTTISKAVNSY